jgi:hypothetical protein
MTCCAVLCCRAVSCCAGVMYTCDAFGLHYCTEDPFDTDVNAMLPHYRCVYMCVDTLFVMRGGSGNCRHLQYACVSLPAALAYLDSKHTGTHCGCMVSSRSVQKMSSMISFTC